MSSGTLALPVDCTPISASHSPGYSAREEEEVEVGTVPDFPPALQVLLDHLHHSPFVQVHFILVSCSIWINNGVLLLCWKESAVSRRQLFYENPDSVKQ